MAHSISVPLGVGSKLLPPLQVDVRLYISMTHRNDTQASRFLYMAVVAKAVPCSCSLKQLDSRLMQR